MGRSRNEQELLAHLLSEAIEFADAGERVRAEASLAAAEDIAADDPDIGYERARWSLLDGAPDDALARLRSVLDADPDHADAHHLSGELLLARNDPAGAARHWVEVLRLDTAAASRRATGASADMAFIETEAQRVLADLPEPFAERLQDVPVVLEPRPHPAVVAEGFDPRALGLFEGGGGDYETAIALLPTRIVLFWANLWEACADEAELAAEVEVTLLHEIGHYFGLDEDEVEALGLG